MELTQFNTYFPADGLVAGNTPLGIARAPHGRPARVLVDNIGATLVFLGGTSSDVAGPEGPSSGTFRLLPGRSQVFVLSPQQVIYAIGSGLGAIITVTGSDAIPLGWERDDKGNFFPAQESKGINPGYHGV